MRIPLVAAFFLLTACATQQAADPDSPYYLMPPGGTAVLEQPVHIPAPGVGVWIQYGKVVAAHHRWYPACKLEMWTRTNQARTVEPDTFRITRVGRGEAVVQWDEGLRPVLNQDEGGPTAFEMQTLLYLKSEQQPDVYRLVCAYWDDPAFPRHLTLNEMRDTLQGIFRLELP